MAPRPSAATAAASFSALTSLVPSIRGHSSVGRALAWHARGRGFESPWLHHTLPHVEPSGGRSFPEGPMPSDDVFTVRAEAPDPGAASPAAGRGAWAEPGVYPVAPGVHRIPLPLPGDSLRAVNVYAIEDDNRIVLVDSGWHRPDSWEALRSALHQIGCEIGDIARVLVTHIHHDHFGQAP